MKRLFFIISCLLILVFSFPSPAAYEARFDAIVFDPAVDGGNYITVYGSRTPKAWQGNLGFYFDYANRPLEFRSTTGARQSILDHVFILNAYGALGFLDWFTVGLNLPVAYNVFFSDTAATADHGPGMGDLVVATKFRLVDIDKYRVGFAVIPYATLPTGDIVRYNGSGHPTAGLKLVLDGRPHERFEISLNLGAVMRDDVTRTFAFTGGGTSTVRVDDLFTYGLGMNIKFTRNFQGIIEAHGETVIRDFFKSNTTPFEADGGVRYYFGDSGFAADVGGGAGIIEGIGSPLFRGYLGLRWTSPVPQSCPECADPRINGDRIILWGKIFFDTDKATIKPISYPVLDDVVDVLNKHPGVTLVEIQGHTDWRASDAYNLNLSQRRAESCRQYLINKGISPGRLKASGYGESRPIASNSTAEGMSKNRRVEFVILESTGGFTQQPSPLDISNDQETTEMPLPLEEAPLSLDTTHMQATKTVLPQVSEPARTEEGFETDLVTAQPQGNTQPVTSATPFRPELKRLPPEE